jgi:hypothetical protein
MFGLTGFYIFLEKAQNLQREGSEGEYGQQFSFRPEPLKTKGRTM